MPLYDYQCKTCENIFEKQTKISEMNSPQVCPNCESSDSEKFIGGAPAIGDPVRLGIKRPDKSWSNVLQRIHERTPGSQLHRNSEYFK